MLLGFSAVNTGNNLLFLVVSGLLAFMCVTGFAGMYNLKKLSPEILLPAELYAGTPALIRIRIHNEKRYLPSFLIRVHCVGDKEVLIPVIPPSGTVDSVARVTFDTRGRVVVGKVTISSTFPVNFFNRYWSYYLDSEYIVFPRLVTGVVRGEGNEAVSAGLSLRQSRGLDGEIESISEYSGREPLRMIHWKLSARGDALLVKEFGRQAASPLLIDLATMPGHTLEQRISRAAWLVKRWCTLRPVGLRLGADLLPAEAGHRHALRILTALALYGEGSR